MMYLIAYYLLTCCAIFVAQATVSEKRKDIVTDWLIFPMLLLTWPLFGAMRLGNKVRKYFCD